MVTELLIPCDHLQPCFCDDCLRWGCERDPGHYVERIRRRRSTGWRMPSNTVYVGRPSIYGNPFRWADKMQAFEDYVEWWLNRGRVNGTVMYEREMGLLMGAMFQTEPHPLRGHNLACWCEEGEPCHAGPLLYWANGKEWPAGWTG